MKFKDEIIIFDDFIEKDYQEKIKNELFGSREKGTEFPWYYIEDVTAAYSDESQHRPGLSHSYVDLPLEMTGDEDDILEPDSAGKVMSDYHKLCYNIIILSQIYGKEKIRALC